MAEANNKMQVNKNPHDILKHEEMHNLYATSMAYEQRMLESE